MSSRLECAGLLAATVVLAGCGGSGHSTTQAPPASQPSPSAGASRTATTGPTSVRSVAPTSTGVSASGTATTHPAAPAPRSGGAAVGGVAPVGGGGSGSRGAAVPRGGGGGGGSGSGGVAVRRGGGGNGGETNARVPATFTLSAPGTLSPRSVSAPAFLAVAVTVIDRDGRSHRVVIRTPNAHVLSVRAGGQSSVLIPGQRAGQYPVEVDGTAAAMLMIGGEPGP